MVLVDRSQAGSFDEFRRRLQIGFLDWIITSGGGLIDTKGKLVSLDGSGLGVLAGLSASFLLSGALSNDICVVAAPEIWSLKLLDGPEIRK